MDILWFLIIGAVAGWVSGQIMKGGGFGLIGNMLVGVTGAIVGGYLFDILEISVGSGITGSLLTAVFGAVALLSVVGLFKRW
jgi:uncharacterized membrane protein YeaQ/YmgE (transglycosylase-associated protein family)